ncbi:MAG: transglutaminase-like cysteine peptidase [Formivibrio sp.]|nr:transglutaminase-like cysteine peptidase [Formivibrio sp.]
MSFSFKGPRRFFLLHVLWSLALVWIVAFSATAWDFDRLQKTEQQRYGSVAAKLVKDWETTLSSALNLPEPDKLKRINEFFNRRVRYDTDWAVWGQEDYWATPLEFMGKGAGDCEDFVIAKYFSLRELGVAKEKLRLTYVRAKIGDPSSSITQAHMVLTYYLTPDAEPLVLDSLISEIRPASRRPDLTPVYSFNTDGVFAGSANRPAAPVERLSRWKDVLNKMQAEGMEP